MLHWTRYAKAQISYSDVQSPSSARMLKEEKTVAQIAVGHQIHPGQLHRGERHALDNFASLHQIGDARTASPSPRPGTDRALRPDWQSQPLTTQTVLLSLTRSRLHYRTVGLDPVEVVVKYHIDEYTDPPSHARITAVHRVIGSNLTEGDSRNLVDG